jgi:hypothetical protein
MNAVIYTRTSSTTPLILPGVMFNVERYSNAAIGGPHKAVIQATGSDTSLWALLATIGCGVKLYSRDGTCRWWGMIKAINATLQGSRGKGLVRAGVSFDTMSNRVAYAYTKIDPTTGAETRETTGWEDDLISQAAYGIKEILMTEDGATSTHAELARAAYLEQHKYPVPVLELDMSGTKEARIECVGWWQTLDWKYYGNAAITSSDTADQVETIIEAGGQFFGGADVDVWAGGGGAQGSGITLSDYKDGDATALYEVMKLLETGTTNSRRMLAHVFEILRVRIYEEPVQATSNTWHLDSAGNLYNPVGSLATKANCPAGVWIRLKDIIPATVDISLISDPSLAFVEMMEYDVINDKLRYVARGAPDPWQFPVMKDG